MATRSQRRLNDGLHRHALRSETRRGDRDRSPGQALDPLRWAGGDLYLTRSTVEGGGRLLYSNGSGAWKLDPSTGLLTQVADANCGLQDVAVDGSLLCLNGQTLTVEKNGSTTATLTVPGTWDGVGEARFEPDSQHIVVSASRFADPQPIVVEKFSGSIVGGTLSAVDNTANVIDHLADGSVVLLVRTSSNPDTPQVDVRSPSGATREVPLPPGDSYHGILLDPQD